MKKVLIIAGVFIAYVLVGIFFLRSTVDTQIGLSQSTYEDYQVIVGKNLISSYHYGEIVVYQNNKEICLYNSELQNSIYRHVLLDDGFIYALGYTFNQDGISNYTFLTKLDLDCNKLNEETFQTDGELYPQEILIIDDILFIVASFSGSSINDFSYSNNGEYEIALIKINNDFSNYTINTYGTTLSELATDIIVDEGKLLISFNQFDSLIEGHENEKVNGYIVTFDPATMIFNHDTLFQFNNNENNRIQGLLKDEDGIYFYGHIVKNGLKTPYVCNYNMIDCTYVTGLNVDGEFVHGAILNGTFQFFLSLEKYAYSDTYGEISRKMLCEIDNQEINLGSINKDIFIQDLEVQNDSIYITGYKVVKNLFKADVTEYYFNKITDINEMTE